MARPRGGGALAAGARERRPLNPHEVIRRLSLRAHPEGGFYAETFRSPMLLSLPDGRVRRASTAIHYLLPPDAWRQDRVNDLAELVRAAIFDARDQMITAGYPVKKMPIPDRFGAGPEYKAEGVKRSGSNGDRRRPGGGHRGGSSGGGRRPGSNGRRH